MNLELTCKAKKWADELASEDTLEHESDLSSQGENLAKATTSGRPWKFAPEEWWYDDEFSNYDFSEGGQADGTDGPYKHMTQMIWDRSVKIGCA